jgi:hypothetical protein
MSSGRPTNTSSMGCSATMVAMRSTTSVRLPFVPSVCPDSSVSISSVTW